MENTEYYLGIGIAIGIGALVVGSVCLGVAANPTTMYLFTYFYSTTLNNHLIPCIKGIAHLCTINLKLTHQVILATTWPPIDPMFYDIYMGHAMIARRVLFAHDNHVRLLINLAHPAQGAAIEDNNALALAIEVIEATVNNLAPLYGG